jgi:flavin reductase (DIM6/NTAB) family NADH-FMN oxidoreductase RutF
MVASWVSQVSYEPPLVMVAIHPNRYSHHLIEQSNCFALHVLAQNQTELIERFKTNVPTDKFDSVHWYRGKTDCPILKECTSW